VLTDKNRVFDVKQTDMCSVITGDTAAKIMAIILKYEDMSSEKYCCRESGRNSKE
jgi:hypothetical protein